MKLALLLYYWIAPISVSAADWIKVRSTNFELLTNSSEYYAGQTLMAFEEARHFILRAQPSFMRSLPSARIVSFNSNRDYRPFSPGGSVAAYFLRHEQGDYIVMSDLEDQERRAALHEYAHLLVSHSGLSIPLWLNEGMAEVYSTLELKEGKLLLGDMKKDRLIALGSENWIPLPLLLRVDQKSADYKKEHRAGVFYAESCLLAHMLMLDDVFGKKFSQFLDRVSVTGSSADAFSEVYGKSTAEIETAMRTYFRRMMQGGVVLAASRPDVQIGPARPAPETEVSVTLADLTAHLGRTDEARKRLREMAASHPGDGYIEASLANVEAFSGDKNAALALYRAAIEHGSKQWTTYWGIARLLDELGGDLAARIHALEDALQRHPALLEARVRLSRNLCANGRPSEALERLQQAEPVGAGDAARLRIEMAQAALRSQRVAQARQYLEQARSTARRPEERAVVEQLLNRIGQTTTDHPASMTGVEEPLSDLDSERPRLRRRQVPAKKDR